MRLFKQFPKISYKHVEMVNIIKRFKVVDDVVERYDIYYPYIIDDSDRLDTLAYDYYGDPYWGWLIMYTNNMIDPYHDWPLTNDEFVRHMVKKHDKTIAELQSTIHHYEYTGIGGSETDAEKARYTWTMTPETYNSLSAADKSGWTSVSVYDYYWNQNEDKRSIRLIDKRYISQIQQELTRIFAEKRIPISRKVLYG